MYMRYAAEVVTSLAIITFYVDVSFPYPIQDLGTKYLSRDI